MFWSAQTNISFGKQVAREEQVSFPITLSPYAKTWQCARTDTTAGFIEILLVVTESTTVVGGDKLWAFYRRVEQFKQGLAVAVLYDAIVKTFLKSSI